MTDPGPGDYGAYRAFIAARTQLGGHHGFHVESLPGHLFDFQAALTRWALLHGRAAIFADCGLGKAPIALAWAAAVHAHTGRPVLILTPLAVAAQLAAEATKFGHDAAVSRTGTITAPIVITNYERLHYFTPADFAGVVCDESSAIKAFDGARRAEVTAFLRKIAYRLLCTATAAPNDYVELGTSSEALGELGYTDMLTRFFTNADKTIDTKGRYRGFRAPREWVGPAWRFKGWAEDPFWAWVSSWARACRRPSDLGFADGRFELPELTYLTHLVEARSQGDAEALFDLPARGIREERQESRRTLVERCETAAALLDGEAPGIAWCHLNDEGDQLTKLIDGAVQVAGSDPLEAKEEALEAFAAGQVRVMVSKPSVAGYGLNWQFCNRMTYFPSSSYEQAYQAVRRCWRFGQTEPVTVHLITTEGGSRALARIQRKAAAADVMFDRLVAHMNHAIAVDRDRDYPNPVEVPEWLT